MATVRMARGLWEISTEQANAVDQLVRAQDEVNLAMLNVDTRTAALHGAVFDALRLRVPARMVAETLGITVSRVYQIRDVVAPHRR